MIIDKTWAMPNSQTFKIKPIKELIERYTVEAKIIIDPFANSSKIATLTNDLNPKFNTDFHLDALTFLKQQKSQSADVILFDPPYSISQAQIMYKSYGKDKLDISVSNMKYWSECKNEVARIIKHDGVVIICGWNTNGLGKNRKFTMLELLIVSHGGSRNDTLITVETPSKE